MFVVNKPNLEDSTDDLRRVMPAEVAQDKFYRDLLQLPSNKVACRYKFCMKTEVLHKAQLKFYILCRTCRLVERSVV